MPNYDPLNLATAVASGPLRITYPFADQGDATTKIYSQKYYQLAANYTAPATSSTGPDAASSAYFIGDEGVTVVESGLVEFTRQWAMVPASRTVAGGSYAFIAPKVRGQVIISPPSIVPGRPAGARITSATFEYSYSRTAITADEPLMFYDNATGDYAEALNNDTTPTNATYQGWVAAGTLVIAESVVSLWRGDIMEKRTVKVRAI